MKEPAAMPDAQALTECYEALRQEALECGGGHTLTGRAALLFKGMAAWMKAMSEAPVRTLTSAAANEMRLPAGIEQNLVNIVATMAFATALEGRA